MATATKVSLRSTPGYTDRIRGGADGIMSDPAAHVARRRTEDTNDFER